MNKIDPTSNIRTKMFGIIFEKSFLQSNKVLIPEFIEVGVKFITQLNTSHSFGCP